MDTSDEWIRTRTGIETRHIAAQSENTSDLCVHAAKQAMEAAGVTADDIDFILVATASPDYVVPSTACLVQDKLGCTHAGAMDISAGCSGYIYAVAVASNMVKAGMYKHILVIGAEILSRLVNWHDRSTCILLVMAQEQQLSGKRKRAMVFWHRTLVLMAVWARSLISRPAAWQNR